MKDKIEIAVLIYIIVCWILMFITLGYCLIVLLNAIYRVS